MIPNYSFLGFPCSSTGKESACNAGDLSLIPGLGRCPGERKSYPLQYSGLKNSKHCIVHGIAKSQTRLSDFHFHYSISIPFPSHIYHSSSYRQHNNIFNAYDWMCWKGGNFSLYWCWVFVARLILKLIQDRWEKEKKFMDIEMRPQKWPNRRFLYLLPREMINVWGIDRTKKFKFWLPMLWTV